MKENLIIGIILVVMWGLVILSDLYGSGCLSGKC